jgi:hypothetical protein
MNQIRPMFAKQRPRLPRRGLDQIVRPPTLCAFDVYAERPSMVLDDSGPWTPTSPA